MKLTLARLSDVFDFSGFWGRPEVADFGVRVAMDVTKPYEFIGFGAMDVLGVSEGPGESGGAPGAPRGRPSTLFFEEKGWGTTRGPFRCS